MSRDMGLTFGSSASGRALCFIAPVGLVRLDEVDREDSPVGQLSDCDVVVVGERQNASDRRNLSRDGGGLLWPGPAGRMLPGVAGDRTHTLIRARLTGRCGTPPSPPPSPPGAACAPVRRACAAPPREPGRIWPHTARNPATRRCRVGTRPATTQQTRAQISQAAIGIPSQCNADQGAINDRDHPPHSSSATRGASYARGRRPAAAVHAGRAG
jgi:hypothetical protein